MTFRGSDLAAADFSQARCSDVDLRGARVDGVKGVSALKGVTIGVDQLVVLAPALAVALGIRIVADD